MKYLKKIVPGLSLYFFAMSQVQPQNLSKKEIRYLNEEINKVIDWNYIVSEIKDKVISGIKTMRGKL